MKSLWFLIAATLIILAYHAGGARQRQFEALCAEPGVLCTVQIKPERFTPQLQGMLAYIPAWVFPVWMEDDGSGVGAVRPRLVDAPWLLEIWLLLRENPLLVLSDPVTTRPFCVRVERELLALRAWQREYVMARAAGESDAAAAARCRMSVRTMRRRLEAA